MEDNILSDISKKIKEFCEKAKLDFSMSLDSYFGKLETKPTAQDTVPTPTLPSKRQSTFAASNPKSDTKPSELEKCRKKPKISSESDSEKEAEYSEGKFSIKLTANPSRNSQAFVKSINEELDDVFSSESYSLMSSDTDKSSKSAETKVSFDIEKLVNDFKSGKDRRKVLHYIEKFVVNFNSLETKEKERCKPILAGLESMKIEQEDAQVKARLNEINAKIKKITNSLSIEEDWPRLTVLFKAAVNEKNKTKITEITRRIGDNFPEKMTQTLINEMTPLLSIVKSLSETMEECETKQKINTIIKKWNMKTSAGHSSKATENNPKIDQIIKDFKKADFENANKPSINCIDAGKSVPGRFRRR